MGKIIHTVSRAEANSILGGVTARLSRQKVLGRHTCMYTCISTHACIHGDINTCLHIYTDMHTYIYTDTCTAMYTCQIDVHEYM